MNTPRKNIEKLPFFNSFLPGGDSKAVIDVKSFHLWLEEVQHLDFLSESDEQDRTDAFKELEAGNALDLKEAQAEW
ncbi:hypothetical protein [Desulfobacter postgatei]|jgi:hypothetical protein|uniref:hypothetical protein n=1 Tax=Desulfobacter postgatei TaxID=2293 RepID=UPI002A36B69A|nr:hypothetical protein [Desulfobacter postgatei]MDX9963950.1 hypothetical protein [Desulfobacter postgatei]